MDGPRRIVLLGKTGVGKSSLANTILGKDSFKISHAPISQGNLPHAEIKSDYEKDFKLIDTFSFFDTGASEATLKADIVRCITECAPGPHAFLVVFKVEKFTEHEKEVVKEICKYFSEEALRYATVVFTHGNQLPEGTTIESFVGENADLRDLVRRCGGRCHVVDNKYWRNGAEDDYRSNRVQVAALLRTLDRMIEANEGRCYTNDMLRAVKREIRKEEGNIGQSASNLSQEEIRDKARERVSDDLMIRLASTTTGALLGALLGVAEIVAPLLFQEVRGCSGRELAASAVLKGVVQGSKIGYDAAGEAKTPSEAIGKAMKAVWKNSWLGADQGNTES